MSLTDTDSALQTMPRREYWRIFWRSFSLLGSFNFERMQGLGFLFAVLPSLRRIYKNDPQGLKSAMYRHLGTFNMTVAPSPLVMGSAIALEERAHQDPKFDPTTISSIKVSLMGPLSGIGDTFFWGIFRIIACSLAIGFAEKGNIIAPIILLVVFNIPNFMMRWYGLGFGYRKGQEIVRAMGDARRMQLFTFCAGIVGAMSMGAMIAQWVKIDSPISFTLFQSKIVIQQYLDQIMPSLLPMAFTLGILMLVKKHIPPIHIIGIVIVAGFILGALKLITGGAG